MQLFVWIWLVTSGAIPQQPVGPPAWLQGCWEARSPRRTIHEQWTAPLAGTMLGVSRTVRGDTLVEFEFVMVRVVDGTLRYDAHPSGQAGAAFTARSVTDTAIVFANPAHDYPQEVGYRRVGTDSLIAWIDGPAGGRSRRIEFPYARRRCE